MTDHGQVGRGSTSSRSPPVRPTAQPPVRVGERRADAHADAGARRCRPDDHPVRSAARSGRPPSGSTRPGPLALIERVQPGAAAGGEQADPHDARAGRQAPAFRGCHDVQASVGRRPRNGSSLPGPRRRTGAAVLRRPKSEGRRPADGPRTNGSSSDSDGRRSSGGLRAAGSAGPRAGRRVLDRERGRAPRRYAGWLSCASTKADCSTRCALSPASACPMFSGVTDISACRMPRETSCTSFTRG